MNNHLALLEGHFRKVFGLAFPILLTLGLVFAAIHFSESAQQGWVEQKRALWAEKAEILLASVRSNHTFADLAEEAGNNLAREIETSFSPIPDPQTYSGLVKKHFSEDFIDAGTLIWYFSIKDGKAVARTGHGLTSTRLRVMERVFNGILEFFHNQNISLQEISTREKFLRGVLGPHSSPLSLGRRRQGKLTPVVFEGRQYYFYWRLFSAEDQSAAGTAILFPAEKIDNIEHTLRIVADRALVNTRRHFGVAFIPANHFRQTLKPIFPEAINANEDYRRKLEFQISQILEQGDDKGNQVFESSDHLFLRGFLTIDLPYDAVIFAPRSAELAPQRHSYSNAAFLVLIFWLCLFAYFYIQNGRIGLPLTVSFRVIFFFSGLLPIFLMLSSGFTLIEESYQNDLLELRRENSARLSLINEKSDNLMPLFGYHISEMLKSPELQNLLSDGNKADSGRAFELICNNMQKLELGLDHLFIFYPGQAPELFVRDNRMYQNAKTNMNISSAGLFELHQRFSQLMPLPAVKLDPGQVTAHKVMGNLPKRFLESSYNLAYERENFLNYGSNSKEYYYSVILSKKGKIACYLTFAVSTATMFHKYLERELNSLNVVGKHIFLAAKELNNSDFALFQGRKMHSLQSQTGNYALNFLKKCRSSIFEKHISDRDTMYLFFPMHKMPGYTGGCVISLSEANYAQRLKQLLLIVTAILFACLMYVAASFATAYMLLPIEKINSTLQAISSGNLEVKIDIERRDELGLLGHTISLMLDGFKERLRLGKFVSSTLNSSLSQNTSLEDLKKAREITGAVLFSDIRGFTTLSETHPPAEIASMLNSHLECMSEQIQKFGGQIEQFIGDAIVAFFPDTAGSDSRKSAVKAAIAAHRAHVRLTEERNLQGSFTYSIGFGIEHGKVIAGSLVTPERCEFSIIGATRLLAEKYEGLSKLGSFSRIIVSANFTEVIAHEDLATCVPLKETDVYELAGIEVPE